jgi:hypothetical protein
VTWKRRAVFGGLAGLFVGCGTGGLTATQLISSASTRTVSTRTANATLTIVSPQFVAGSTGPMTVHGTGVVDFARGLARFDLVLPVNGTTVHEAVIQAGTTVYDQTPARLVSYVGGRHWVRIDLADSPSAVSQTGGDASQLVQALHGVSNVHVVGHRKLDGVSVTEYQATLQPGGTALAGAGPIPVAIWIDADRQVRKLTESIDYSRVSLGGTKLQLPPGVTTITMTFNNFGVAADITAPAAGDVADFATFQHALAAGQGT